MIYLVPEDPRKAVDGYTIKVSVHKVSVYNGNCQVFPIELVKGIIAERDERLSTVAIPERDIPTGPMPTVSHPQRYV